MKSIVKRALLLIIMVIILLSGEIFAEEGFKAIEKSAEFEKWENLSDTERKYIPQPSYTDLNISNSLKKSTYNSLVNLGTTEDDGKYIPAEGSYIVKDQKNTGLCWAFSFTSVLENTIAKKYSRPSLEYSPLYLDYNVTSNFLKPIGDGANFRLCEATAVSGKGLTYESDMPFSNYYNEETNAEEDYYLSYVGLNPDTINSKVKINETTYFASIYKSYAEDGTVTYKDSSSFFGAKTYSDAEVAAIRDQIKKHIKENGAVSSNLYTGNFENQYKEGTTTCAFYSDSYMLNSDHAITIVGWDDSYSRTNFADGKQPAKDGAYIVLNSWGDKFGKNGYFYVSYDDAFIEQDVAGIDNLQEYSEEEKEYTNLYQHDELGMSLSFYFLNDKMTEYANAGYMANVFKREDVSKNEWLSEVGIYVPSTQGIEIYVDSENADMKDYGETVASYTGTNALEPGYHNIKLASPVEIKGESFAVIAKCINENGAMYSLECNLKDSGVTNEDNYFSKAESSVGESYMSNNGSEWIDVNSYQIPITTTQLTTLKNTNVCIKAFTMETEAPEIIPVTEVEMNKESIELKKGNTETILATVKPDNATNRKVTWSSSDQAIATVNDGVVTGISEGTATITVTTDDGNKTDSCEVKVIADELQKPIVSVTNVKIDLQLPEGVTLVVEEGTTYTVNAVVEPSDATNKKVTWSSSDENIATVTGGVIKGISEGTATITVTTEDGNKTDSINVKVEPTTANIKVESIKLDKSTLKLEVGDETNLVVSFNPTNASNKSVAWSSSNTNVATISKTGIIKAISEGTTTITVTSEDGNKTATCELTVVKKTNTDDDIYKDNTDGENKNPNENNLNNNKDESKNENKPDKTDKTDNTIAKDKLPNTGFKIVLTILGIGIMFVGVISFIRYRKLMDIK